MKKVLVYRWKAYNQMDVERAFLQAGVELSFTDFVCSSIDEDEAFVKKFAARIREEDYDFVFSVNYFTVISNACEQVGVPYVSWLCDSRLLTMHNRSVFNKCNYIFVFDRVDYAEFTQLGARVFYLPLAVDVNRLDALLAGKGKTPDAGAYVGEGSRTDYRAEISFVGSMYAGKNEYDKCRGELTPYLQGYFDAALRAQMDVYGEDVIAQLMTPDIMVQLEQTLRFEKAEDSFSTLPLVFSVTHLGFKLANLERMELLGRLGRTHQVALYSDVEEDILPCVEHRGRIDYWNEMPFAFHESKINLNITMRNIRTGLPLRVFDILGSGGFLLTNFQAELPAFFEPGKDLAVYESFPDCEKKADYYLNHEDERCTIAANGYRKVKAHHTYEKRVEELLRIIDEK
jgi:spore maturation protein CgeB